jgi:rSAM/selenodomain-associated transferase 1
MMRNSATCMIGVMAKAPRAGRAKTRLCPALLPEQAARLSAAFLRDITENLVLASRFAPVARCVAYAPAGDEGLLAPHLAPDTALILADGAVPTPPGVQGFGRCLLHATRAMLARGHGAACVLNSDSPTLPTSILTRAAAELLRAGERVVLGPAQDGGYYLLGMTRVHAPLFADIAWSTDSVAAATRERAATLGLEVVELPVWYDVDDESGLARLRQDVAGGDPVQGLRPYHAPATAAVLDQFGLRGTELRAAAE